MYVHTCRWQPDEVNIASVTPGSMHVRVGGRHFRRTVASVATNSMYVHVHVGGS